jgi:hypothetical protein
MYNNCTSSSDVLYLKGFNDEEGRFFALLQLLLDNHKEFLVKICILHKFTVMQIFLDLYTNY